MNKIGATNTIAFKSSQTNSIKKACNILSEKIGQSPKTPKIPVDCANIGDKAYISAAKNGTHTIVKVEINDKKGLNSYTFLKPQSAAEIKKFLKTEKAHKLIENILDSLKNALQKANNTESYRG